MRGKRKEDKIRGKKTMVEKITTVITITVMLFVGSFVFMQIFDTITSSEFAELKNEEEGKVR